MPDDPDPRLLAAHARALAADPAFAAAVARVRLDLHEAWARSGPDATDLRERLHAELRALDRVEAALTRLVEDAKAEDRREEYLGTLR